MMTRQSRSEFSLLNLSVWVCKGISKFVHEGVTSIRNAPDVGCTAVSKLVEAGSAVEKGSKGRVVFRRLRVCFLAPNFLEAIHVDEKPQDARLEEERRSVIFKGWIAGLRLNWCATVS